MSNTDDLNARPKIIPKKVEPISARARDAEAVAQAMATAEPSVSSAPLMATAESLQRPQDVGEQPAPMAMHPADIAAQDVVREATARELEEHIEAFGAGFVRKPFAERQMRLSAPRRPGFHRHWVNDIPGRVAHMQERGYKIVTERGNPIKKTVSVAANGAGLDGFLMEIPVQWFEKDQRESQKAADEIEATIRRGEVAVGDGRNRYIPRDGIDIRDERQGSPLVPLRG